RGARPRPRGARCRQARPRRRCPPRRGAAPAPPRATAARRAGRGPPRRTSAPASPPAARRGRRGAAPVRPGSGPPSRLAAVLQRGDALPQRVEGGLRTVVEAQLREDLGEAVAHGPLAHAQPLGDLLVRGSLVEVAVELLHPHRTLTGLSICVRLHVYAL